MPHTEITFQAELESIQGVFLLRLSNEMSQALPSRGMVMMEGRINGLPITAPAEPNMTYFLSLLDKSPIPGGSNPERALADTVAYARHAEKLGYHRFWLAEHHGSAEVAGVAPEILAAWVLASTERIRVGSGGVMPRMGLAKRPISTIAMP